VYYVRVVHRPAATSIHEAQDVGGAARRADDRALLYCDLRRRVTGASAAAEGLLGRSTAQLRGAVVESLAPLGARVQAAAELAALMYDRPGSWGTIGLAPGGPDAGPLPLEVSCRPRPGSDGYVVELRRPADRSPEAAPSLSARERQVFELVAAGRTGAEIAAELFLAPATVERHVANALRKLGARNRPHGVALVLRPGGPAADPDAEARSADALRDTVETLDDPAALVALDGTVVAVNEAWRAFGRANGRFGVQAEQNYLRVCEQATAGDDAARAAAGLRDVLEGRRDAFSMEYRCDAPGRPGWFRLRATRCRGTDGATALVRHRDLTPQRLAERAADLGTAALDGVDAATFVYAVDGTVTAWMAGAQRLLGWTPAEAVGRPVWELFLGRRHWAAGRAILEAVARTGRWSGELEFERRDGSTFHGHVRDRLVRDPDGGSTGRIVGVVTNTSARHSAEHRAAAASRALCELAETMRDGWIATDAAGRITRVNGAALRMLGREERELVGHDMRQLVRNEPPDGAASPGGPRGTRAPDGRGDVRHECLLTKDGRALPVDFTVSDGSPAGARGDGGPDTGRTIVFWEAQTA
jgi:PAS domain S-box-containing protein